MRKSTPKDSGKGLYIPNVRKLAGSLGAQYINYTHHNTPPSPYISHITASHIADIDTCHLVYSYTYDTDSSPLAASTYSNISSINGITYSSVSAFLTAFITVVWSSFRNASASSG